MALGSTHSSFADVVYNVSELGTLGGLFTMASSINDSGQITGYSETQGPSCFAHAFIYSGGEMSDLGTLGGNISLASSINNAGEIAGSSYTASGAEHGFIYSNGQLTDFNSLIDPALGITVVGIGAVNNAGQMIGAYETQGSLTEHSFLYSNGQIQSLGIFGPSGLNDSGEMSGSFQSPTTFAYHAALYSNGQMTDAGTLPGGFNSFGLAINNSGQMVGESETSTGSLHAFIYSNGVMTDLGTLGGDYSEAVGINNAGQIVGSSFLPFGPSNSERAFIYSNGQMTDLNDLIDPGLGITLARAYAINNVGQIVGEDYNGDAVLLTPVPEPDTVALMAFGLIGWTLLRRRASSGRGSDL